MHVCKRASPELEPYITLRLTGRVLSAASQVCLERLRLRHLLTRLYHVTRMYVYMCVGTVYSIGSNSEFVLTRELRVRINGHHHTLHVCTGTVTTVRSARRGWWWSTQCEMASYCIRMDPSVRPRRVLVGFNSLAFRRL